MSDRTASESFAAGYQRWMGGKQFTAAPITEPLHLQVARCAAGWMDLAGAALQMWPRLRPTDVLFYSADPAERALLTAACELLALLAESAEGRKALGDLGLQDFLEQVEGVGG